MTIRLNGEKKDEMALIIIAVLNIYPKMRKMAPSSSYSAFSYTSAPFVSQEDKQRAKDSLSETDLLQIHNDLFGIQNRIITTATNDDCSSTSARTCSLECSDREEDGAIEGEADNCARGRLLNSLNASAKQSEAADTCERADQSIRRILGHRLIQESLDLLPMDCN